MKIFLACMIVALFGITFKFAFLVWMLISAIAFWQLIKALVQYDRGTIAFGLAVTALAALGTFGGWAL